MVDLRCELNVGRLERIIYRKLNPKLEDTSLIGAFSRTNDKAFPLEHVFSFRSSATVRRRVLLEICEFFLNTP
jgi:hypothetical protein